MMSSKKFCILFDLDQTLVDSNCVKFFRDNRNWSEVFKNLDKVKPFNGISELLSTLNEDDIKIVIISSSPKSYCQKIIRQNNWFIDAIVGYHDTDQHKPHPKPILLGLEKIDVSPNNALSVGDLSKDVIASRRAGVTSVGATWGCENIADLIAASPDKICYNVDELKNFIQEFFNIF
jgi:HAD superfamily hydrolase (TIGR01549 family)